MICVLFWRARATASFYWFFYYTRMATLEIVIKGNFFWSTKVKAQFDYHGNFTGLWSNSGTKVASVFSNRINVVHHVVGAVPVAEQTLAFPFLSVKDTWKITVESLSLDAPIWLSITTTRSGHRGCVNYRITLRWIYRSFSSPHRLLKHTHTGRYMQRHYASIISQVSYQFFSIPRISIDYVDCWSSLYRRILVIEIELYYVGPSFSKVSP